MCACVRESYTWGMFTHSTVFCMSTSVFKKLRGFQLSHKTHCEELLQMLCSSNNLCDVEGRLLLMNVFMCDCEPAQMFAAVLAASASTL